MVSGTLELLRWFFAREVSSQETCQLLSFLYDERGGGFLEILSQEKKQMILLSANKLKGFLPGRNHISYGLFPTFNFHISYLLNFDCMRNEAGSDLLTNCIKLQFQISDF